MPGDMIWCIILPKRELAGRFVCRYLNRWTSFFNSDSRLCPHWSLVSKARFDLTAKQGLQARLLPWYLIASPIFLCLLQNIDSNYIDRSSSLSVHFYFFLSVRGIIPEPFTFLISKIFDFCLCKTLSSKVKISSDLIPKSMSSVHRKTAYSLITVPSI